MFKVQGISKLTYTQVILFFRYSGTLQDAYNSSYWKLLNKKEFQQNDSLCGKS
jgi:hypothetical protein